jgi:hypothetical protein
VNQQHLYLPASARLLYSTSRHLTAVKYCGLLLCALTHYCITPSLLQLLLLHCSSVPTHPQDVVLNTGLILLPLRTHHCNCMKHTMDSNALRSYASLGRSKPVNSFKLSNYPRAKHMMDDQGSLLPLSHGCSGIKASAFGNSNLVARTSYIHVATTLIPYFCAL